MNEECDRMAADQSNIIPQQTRQIPAQETATMGFMQEITSTHKPPFFTGLRNNDWSPHFHWETSLHGTAKAINQPHEDYPARVPPTKTAIQQTLDELSHGFTITAGMLRQIHRTIFPDHGDNAGQWRTINVQVADHLAPRWEWMDNLMDELEQRYLTAELSLDALKHWYYDFNTIYPLRNGNARTAGVIVAAFSYHLHGIYLTPGQ